MAADFNGLLDVNCDMVATFLSQREVAMMVMTCKAGSRPWRMAVARNNRGFEALCQLHAESSWPGYAIFNTYRCGCCEKRVCDLCIEKNGMWCPGPPDMEPCPGYGISDIGFHDRTPLCSHCTVDGGSNRRLCARCFSDDEREITGDFSASEQTSTSQSGESSWESFEDEDMLD